MRVAVWCCVLTFTFFCSDFEKILAQLHWPNISPTAQSLAPVGNHQELSVQLELLVTQLLALQNTYPSAPRSQL